MFCANVGNKATVGDVVEGQERGWRADNKEPLYSKEGDAIWAVFGQESEAKAQ